LIDVPCVGYGTGDLRGIAAYHAVGTALGIGYRHIDTATVYGNESYVGRAVADSGLDRSEIFLTTKTPPTGQRGALINLEQSLYKLGTDYLDLWLAHWDGADIFDAWEVMLRARERGVVRHVGVSNIPPERLAEMVAAGIEPEVNQVAWGPTLSSAHSQRVHASAGVLILGHSALRAGVLTSPVVQEIALRTGWCAAQVVLAWSVRHAIPVLACSRRRVRMIGNLAAAKMTLAEADMRAIDRLSPDNPWR
jgi:2,5-diketo-D-gluconate reductase A